jgi:hypothetical protein
MVLHIDIDTIDLVVPADITRDFAVGHKRPLWAWKTL